MKILVAGGTGHTGERVVGRLIAGGHEVAVLTRKPGTHPVVAELKRGGAGIVCGDCTRRWTLWRALEGRDALISCAHIRYAGACVQACRRVGVRRYIQMSSTRGLSRFTEHPSVKEVQRGEHAIRRSDLIYTIIRPTMIYGGPRDANVEKLVAWFRKRDWFPLPGDGQGVVQPVFVDDVVQAIVAALERTEASSRRAFTVGGGAPLTYRAMIDTVSRAVRDAPPNFIRIPILPCRLAARLLGRRNLLEMIDRLAEDRSVETTAMREVLGVKAATFAAGMERKLRSTDRH